MPLDIQISFAKHSLNGDIQGLIPTPSVINSWTAASNLHLTLAHSDANFTPSELQWVNVIVQRILDQQPGPIQISVATQGFFAGTAPMDFGKAGTFGKLNIHDAGIKGLYTEICFELNKQLPGKNFVVANPPHISIARQGTAFTAPERAELNNIAVALAGKSYESVDTVECLVNLKPSKTYALPKVASKKAGAGSSDKKDEADNPEEMPDPDFRSSSSAASHSGRSVTPPPSHKKKTAFSQSDVKQDKDAPGPTDAFSEDGKNYELHFATEEGATQFAKKVLDNLGFHQYGGARDKPLDVLYSRKLRGEVSYFLSVEADQMSCIESMGYIKVPVLRPEVNPSSFSFAGASDFNRGLGGMHKPAASRPGVGAPSASFSKHSADPTADAKERAAAAKAASDAKEKALAEARAKEKAARLKAQQAEERLRADERRAAEEAQERSKEEARERARAEALKAEADKKMKAEAEKAAELAKKAKANNGTAGSNNSAGAGEQITAGAGGSQQSNATTVVSAASKAAASRKGKW